MQRTLIACTAGLILAACMESTVPSPVVEVPPASVSPASALLSWNDLTSRPLPQPTTQISYGAEPFQVVDVWLPDGAGPYQTVLMIHGGCWQKAIADRTLMNYAAEDLRARGLAVWNIEYRGVDEPGGGYPSTFLDAAAAADALADHAETYNLKTDRIIAFGHSAGGHLAAWLAARGNLDASSPLAGATPKGLYGVINSGGLADLEASLPVTLESCLANIADTLTGPASEDRPNVYADTSPARMQPASAIQVSANGDSDRIAPALLGEGYTDLVNAAGGQARFVELPASGHVELITPGTVAFETQAELIIALFDED